MNSILSVTGAWILTGGTHTGVMKHVGRAVRDYNLSSNAVGGQIVTIGVATWGVIHNRQALVHPEVITFLIHLTRFSYSEQLNTVVQYLAWPCHTTVCMENLCMFSSRKVM